MIKYIRQRFHHPLSLRWKWGIILFITFTIFAGITLLVYRNETREAHQNFYSDRFDQQSQRAFDLIEEVSETSSFDEVITLVNDIEREGVSIRLFNQNNQLVYEGKPLGISTGNIEEEAKVIESKEGPLLITSKKLDPKSSMAVGTIQYIENISDYRDLELGLDRTLSWLMGGMVLITLVIAPFISFLFLKPLNYLNNSLDLVEEESLSDMRVKRPKSTDEWSELIVHINRLLDRIDKYVSSQKQFVEDVSHELRTPVAIVEGHLKLLNRWGKNDPEILEESITASLQEITRMKDLVQEMLDLSRADHVDVDYKHEITEIYATTRQIYNNFVILHTDFTFFLDTDREGEDCYVQIYRNHFEQILIILLDNAVKYSLDRKEIHISISQGIRNIEIAVQDFGEGMSEDDKEKVFSRFYRVDKARSREKGGNGLGLSIAKQLIEGYGGNIRLESSLNYGSIFYIEFPILKDSRQIYKSKQIAERKSI